MPLRRKSVSGTFVLEFMPKSVQGEFVLFGIVRGNFAFGSFLQCNHRLSLMEISSHRNE